MWDSSSIVLLAATPLASRYYVFKGAIENSINIIVHLHNIISSVNLYNKVYLLIGPGKFIIILGGRVPPPSQEKSHLEKSLTQLKIYPFKTKIKKWGFRI